VKLMFKVGSVTANKQGVSPPILSVHTVFSVSISHSHGLQDGSQIGMHSSLVSYIFCPKTVTDVFEDWTNSIAAVECVNCGSTDYSYSVYLDLIDTISRYLPRSNTCKQVGKCISLKKQTSQGINSAT
jgi:Zn ribbon nucleic-acid-binding protein